MSWDVSLLDTGEHYSDTEAPYIYGTGAVRSNAHLRDKDAYGIKLPAGSKYTIYSTIFRGFAASYKSFSMGAAFYLTALPASSTAIMGGDVTAIKKHFYLTLGSDGTLSVWYQSKAIQLGIATITTGKHYYIEISGYRTPIANDGGVKVAVNGETVFSQSSMLVNTTVIDVWFNAPSAVDLYLSGIYVLRGGSESGPQLLGPIWVKALPPITDGTYSELTPSTGTDHYAVIDESQPNTADYLALNETGPAQELFTVEALGETDSVKAVCPMVYACAQTQDATAGQVEIWIRQGTTDFIVAGPVDTDRDNRYYSGGDITQMASSLAWTAAAIASAEFGFEITGYTGSPDNEMRVSQFIVLVALEYTLTTSSTEKLKVAQQLIEVAFPFAGEDQGLSEIGWEEGYERCILFEIEWADETSSPTINTEYLSNIGYVSFPGDVPEHQQYPDLVVSMPTLLFRVDEMTQFGELVIYNQPDILNSTGLYDLWHQKAIISQEIRCYIGKRSWIRSRFKQFFSGVVTAIKYDRDANMVLYIADKSSLLDKSTKKQTIYGQVFNCEPYFVGPSDPIYKIDQTTTVIESVTDVRDNGVSLGGSPPAYTLSDGKRTLTLDASPVGKVTFDAYKEPVPSAIAVIATVMTDAGFTSDDYDLSALLPVNYTVGYYIAQDQEITYLEVIKQVANSCGGYCHFDYEGILRFYKLDLTVEPITDFTIDDVVDGKIEISEIRDPAATFKLGYKRNFSVQDADALAGSVSDADRKAYSTEWLYHEVDNGLSTTVYPNAEDTVVETFLQDSADAEAEAERRALIRSVRNYTLSFTMAGLQVFLKLGDNVTLDYPRYGLDGGKVCAIIGLNFRPDVFQTDITLWTTELNP